MRKKHLFSILFLLFLLVCVFGVILFWTFMPPTIWMFLTPTNTPCTPISYPEGNKLRWDSTKIYNLETNDAYSDVVDFYKSRLTPALSSKDSYDPINWDAYPIRDVGMLFVCGSLLDGYTSEIGCIYVSEKSGKGVIDITWSYLISGPAVPCDVLPGIEPVDYLPTP